ncbi:MAG: hypothetical protein ACLFWR_10320 [Acidimicrobiales bacterium]
MALAAAAVTVVVGGLAAAAVLSGDAGDPVITDASTPTSDHPPTVSGSTSSTTSTSLPTTAPTSAPAPPTPEDERLAESFLRFAAAPGPDTMANLPLADEVALGLGPRVYTVRTRAELADPDAWLIDVSDGFYFRGYVPPFSALDTAQADDAGDTVVSVGDHPHCVSPPVPAPAELNGLRRISIQPDPAELESCILWWTVDLFVTPGGEVAGVTLDLWEP